MPTLTQYWNDEVTRIQAALASAQSDLAQLRTAVPSSETAQRATADEVRKQADAVAAARGALAAIPMPADGDPLLNAMDDALVALHASQAKLALDGLDLLLDRASLKRAESLVQRLTAELTAAKATRDKETKAAAERLALANKFKAGGALENLVTDALAALANHKATAVGRVEGEFPTSATPNKNFLARVRDRVKLVAEIEASVARAEAPAYQASAGALAAAQRDFAAAVAAFQATADAATQVAADGATLARLAALPAANSPTSYPILTRWQHDRLHDPALQTQREDTLEKLADVDDARRALIAKQEAYDKALNLALAAEPDKTVSQLDATTIATELGELVTAKQGLSDARTAYDALPSADRAALDKWFAAVPDTLWEALAALDGAVARLEKISGTPTPGDLELAMNNAEVALEAAQRASRLEARKTLGAELAGSRAADALQALRDMAGPLQSNVPHGSALW